LAQTSLTHEQRPIYARVRRFRLAKGAKFQQDLGRCESYLGDVGLKRDDGMAALISGKDVEMVLRDTLTRDGYKVSREREHGETGTDIVARRGSENLHIEAIAFKRSPPARAKDFYEVFFRAVSRLQNGATSCVIALPSRFGMGLPQRAKAISPAWCRIGDSFPELKIWLVDTEERSIKRTDWNDWSHSN
jgi:hypothetical protein